MKSGSHVRSRSTPYRTIEQYLRALGKRFGEDVQPEPLGTPA